MSTSRYTGAQRARLTQKLIADFNAGMTLKQIGQKHDLGPSTVRDWLVAAGVKMRPRSYQSRASE